MYLSILLFPLLLVCVRGLSFDPAAFEHSQLLGQNVSLYWTVRQELNVVDIGVAAPVSSWLAFGFSANGGMYGADLYVYQQPGGAGSWRLEHRFSSAFATPSLSSSNGISRVRGSSDSGWTSFSFRRLLKSCANETFPLLEQGNTIIYAYGSSPELSYHGNNRGSVFVNFFADPPPPVTQPPGATILELRMPPLEIPSNRSDSYICVNLPLPSDRKYHILQSRPLLHSSHVHHMLLYGCTERVPLNTPYMCFNMLSQCSTPLLGWAPGGVGVVFPPEAGMPFGTVDTAVYVAVQIHYNNPDGIVGQFDASGFAVTYSAQLRQYDVGSLLLGIPPSPASLQLSPGFAAVERIASCPSSCLQQYLPLDGVKILSVGLHMHLLGRRSWIQHIRNGTEIPELIRQDWFNFNYQGRLAPPPDRMLLPEDRLVAHCIWDTTTTTNITVGGENSAEEMCNQFILYYPAVPLKACVDIGSNLSFCATQDDLASNASSVRAHAVIPQDPSAYVPLPLSCVDLRAAGTTRRWILWASVGTFAFAAAVFLLILFVIFLRARHTRGYQPIPSE